MPGWKRDVGRRLDALIVRTVPGVRKAVKWNSPFYGVEGQGWFLNFHCFTNYVKVAFFRGTSLRPVPPASPSTRKCATSTSARTTSSTRRRWRRGSGRRPPCPAGSRSAGRIFASHRSPGVNIMAGKTSMKSAKVTKKAAAKAPTAQNPRGGDPARGSLRRRPNRARDTTPPRT